MDGRTIPLGVSIRPPRLWIESDLVELSTTYLLRGGRYRGNLSNICTGKNVTDITKNTIDALGLKA